MAHELAHTVQQNSKSDNSRMINRYTIMHETVSKEKYRVADDRSMMVAQERSIGGQEFYAEPGK